MGKNLKTKRFIAKGRPSFESHRPSFERIGLSPRSKSEDLTSRDYESGTDLEEGDCMNASEINISEINAGEIEEVVIKKQAITCAICLKQPCVCSQNMMCDACVFCKDKCSHKDCSKCINKTKRKEEMDSYSMCEIRRHNTERDCWLIASGYVYNATEIIPIHPGGRASILNSTSRDCTRDLDFHGPGGKKMWSECKIGKVMLCEGRVKAGIKDIVPSSGCVIS